MNISKLVDGLIEGDFEFDETEGVTVGKRSRNAGHDYDPAWDYEPDSSPHKEVHDHVKGLLNYHKSKFGVHKTLGLKGVQVHFVKDSLGKKTAKYVDGTHSSPSIVMNSHHVAKLAKKHGVSIEDAVDTTLHHEYAHAYFDKHGYEHDDEEERAEDFAHHAWMSGDHESAKSILDP